MRRYRALFEDAGAPLASGRRMGGSTPERVGGARRRGRDRRRARSEELSEPLVAAGLAEWLPSDATLFVASSMPVRDVEEFFPVRGDPPRVLSNRGANGIDGTVSSAFGVAAVGTGPVVLLIGDVALAHDIGGGLLAAGGSSLALTRIVLLNNDGGGIFHFLPVAGETDAFEEHVATPHGLDFSLAAAALRLRVISVPSDIRSSCATCRIARAARRSRRRSSRSVLIGSSRTSPLHRRVSRRGGWRACD